MYFFSLLPRYRTLDADIQAYQTFQASTRQDIEAYQLERLNKLWIAGRSQYRSLLNKRPGGVPESFRTIEEYQREVPILRRADVVRNGAETYVTGSTQGASWWKTGGSTGQPLRVLWGHDDYLEVSKAKWVAYALHGVNPFDRTAMVWGRSAQFGLGISGVVGRLRSNTVDQLKNRVRISAYSIDEVAAKRLRDELQTSHTKMIYGYASAVAELCRLLRTDEKFGRTQLKCCVMTSEPVYGWMKQRCESVLGCPAVEEYGAAECHLMAFEDPDRKIRIRENLVLMETVPAKEGLWEIVITPLSNRRYALFRYAIGDIAVAPRTVPATGFSTLGGIMGRESCLLVDSAGRFVHSEIVTHIVEQFEGVRRLKAVQSKEGHLQLTLEQDGKGSTAVNELIRKQLTSVLGPIKITIASVYQIESQPNGKFSWISRE